MYAKGDVAGSGDSTIRVVFPGNPANDADVSVVIYNWEDEGLLGIRPANATTVGVTLQKLYIYMDASI